MSVQTLCGSRVHRASSQSPADSKSHRPAVLFVCIVSASLSWASVSCNRVLTDSLLSCYEPGAGLLKGPL